MQPQINAFRQSLQNNQKPHTQPQSKYRQLLNQMQEQSFYDDSMFFDKKNIFTLVNPPQKKIKTIYHKIILSNKNDPLHPSSYRKYESNQAKYDLLKNKTSLIEKIYESTRKINSSNEFQRSDILNRMKEKIAAKDQQRASRDRKRFFKNLLKRFTQTVDQEPSVHYKQKVHLFRKMFQHYKIKPEQKEHFQQLLKKLSEKQTQALYQNTNISTKMTLESRRNNYSVNEKRSDSPRNLRLRMKDKQIKTSQQRRVLKQNNLSDMLSIQSRTKNDLLSITNTSTVIKTQTMTIPQLERQLSQRKADLQNKYQLKNVQQQQSQAQSSNNYISFSPNRQRNFEKKLNFSIIRQQTPIDIKLQKFRQFLYALNFSNHIFVPLEVDKYQTTFKIFVGKGNNSNLIKAIFKKRFWFQVTKNVQQAHLIWTQIKDQNVFLKQQGKEYILPLETSNNTKGEQQVDQINNEKLEDSQNPQEEQMQQQKVKITEQNVDKEEQKVVSENKMIDFKSLKLKKRPDVSKFISVQSQRLYRSQKKAEKPSCAQQTMKENIVKIKKYPQILLLKSINQQVSKNPLSKIFSLEQMKTYDKLYSKYTKSTLPVPGSKIPTFNERKNDILSSPNARFIKEDQKQSFVMHNHMPFNGILGNKKAMFYILKEYCDISGSNLFQIVPLTFHIKNGLKDEEFKKFAQQYETRRKSNLQNYWVMKPGQFSNRGNGIQCTNKIQQVRKRVQNCTNRSDPKKSKAPMSTKSIILQSYITNLLLYNGRKFDIRTYMMVTTVNGKIKAYWYEEGYIRTSSYIWSLSEIQDREVHLTNDAVQKYSDTYGKYEPGNKLSYRDIQRYLETYEKASKNVMYDKILPQMKQIAALCLKASYLFLDPKKLQNNFEIFGFDFMLDTKLKPWLIEINTNPCLQLGCPILQRIIPNMLQNAFRIAIDPLFPPPSSFSSNYKYNIAENAVNYNKFQLIFDEDRDGPKVKKLFQGKDLGEILVKIQDIQQDKEIFQEDGQEIDLTQKI